MATMNDIKKSTGYSLMTISRVINTPEKVDKKTREKIQSKIDELGYTPNRSAKSLASNKTLTIFLYVRLDLQSNNPFFLNVVSTIGDVLGDAGYSVLISRKKYQNQSCDGIISIGMTLEEERDLVAAQDKKPVILFGNNDLFKNCVDIDNYLGFYEITKYVINKGYKDIGYIGVNQDKKYAIERTCGFDTCIKDHNIEIKKQNKFLVDNTENDGYLAATDILNGKDVKVIICSSDLQAMGALRAAKKLNLRVPEDVAITGYDGLGNEMMTYPHITTMRQPISEAGVKIAELMLDVINGNDKSNKIKLLPQIVENMTI